MRIEIVVEVDDEIVDPQHGTGLTEGAYGQVVDAITSTVGQVVSVHRQRR